MGLKPHPRLYAGKEELSRLKKTARQPLLKQAADEVAEQAEEYCRSPVFEYPVNTHNAHLVRARRMQTRVLALLVRWVQTEEERFRNAVMDHVREMGAWEYWSWITWRQKDPRPEVIFDLSYGENTCSFGDVNHWKPLPFHYAAAIRLGCADLVPLLDGQLERQGIGSAWPDAAELLLFHPRKAGRKGKAERNVVRLYRGMDWGVLADRLPNPSLYLAVRGGTTEVPHGHRDLLSFHCVVGEEALIDNVGVGEYLDTTFSSRRYELFETTPASKNTLLINGVGITGGSSVKTRVLKYGVHKGILMDATGAMGSMRDGPAVRFCGRLFLLLKNGALLIVDRVELSHFGRVEARFHTYAEVKTQRNRARISGKKERLNLNWVADVPACLYEAVGAPTTPGRSANMLRWCTQGLHHEVTLATLMSPGEETAEVSLGGEDGHLVVSGLGKGGRTRVRLTKRLRPVR